MKYLTISKSFITISISILFLSGCSASKPSFYHPKHGELLVSSPLLDKELRSCSNNLNIKQPSMKMNSAPVFVAAIPIILEEDIGIGFSKATDIL